MLLCHVTVLVWGFWKNFGLEKPLNVQSPVNYFGKVEDNAKSSAGSEVSLKFCWGTLCLNWESLKWDFVFSGTITTSQLRAQNQPCLRRDQHRWAQFFRELMPQQDQRTESNPDWAVLCAGTWTWSCVSRHKRAPEELLVKVQHSSQRWPLHSSTV